MVNWLENKRGLSLTLTILLAIEIFWFSNLQIGGGVGGVNYTATIYHFVVFFLFNFFLIATIKGKNKLKMKYILIALIISLLYSISDEIHQIFVPLRDGNIRDVFTDSLGIFISTLIYLFIERKSTHLSKKEPYYHPSSVEEYENEHEEQFAEQLH